MQKNHLHLRSFLCLFLALGMYFNLSAECIVRNTAATTVTVNAPVTSNSFIRQVFTACESGPLQSLMFTIDKSSYKADGAMVRIYPNSSVIGVPTSYDPGTIIAATDGISGSTMDQFLYGTIDIPSGSGEETLTFIPSVENAPDLVAGTEYTLEIIMNVQSTSTPDLTSDINNSTGRNTGGIQFVAEDLATGSTDANVGELTTGAIGDGFTTSINNASGRAPFALVFAMAMGNQAAQAPIPTMSEWGLMIFGLLVLNLGVMFIYKRDNVLDIK